MEAQGVLYNVHTHRKPQTKTEYGIRNAYLLNTEQIQAKYPLSSGLHPWLVNNISEVEMVRRLENNILTKKIVAIGEIGLDKFYPNFQKQQHYFDKQLALAEEHQLPVILHLVRALDEADALLRNFNGPVILHGFNGNSKVWEQLNRKGNVYASFGASVFNQSKKAAENLMAVDPQRILAETDSSAYNIQSIYKAISDLRVEPIDGTIALINANAQRIFGKP
jgi:TatD DNase family protein